MLSVPFFLAAPCKTSLVGDIGTDLIKTGWSSIQFPLTLVGKESSHFKSVFYLFIYLLHVWERSQHLCQGQRAVCRNPFHL